MGAHQRQRHATLSPGSRSRLAPNWDEDLLLPRQWDPWGHAVGLMAPNGWIAATDPDGKEWEVRSVGFRNPYDIALNADGELFTYDADAEWELGMPWYRPTCIAHATPGGEFGWRTSTGLWPTYRINCLPAAVNIGQGSPVGLEFGYETKFPAKYQRALFALDWTFSTMYAVHLHADGASYTGAREEFLTRTPLPLTDAAVGPDGALYFITGGRSTQSELYRVTYVGTESTAPVDAQRDTRFADCAPASTDRGLFGSKRRSGQSGEATHWTVGSRRPPHSLCRPRRARAAPHPAVASPRAGRRQSRLPDRRSRGPRPHGRLAGPTGIARGTRSARLPPAHGAAAVGLFASHVAGLHPFRRTEPEVAARLAATFDPYYPATSDPLNRELCDLLVFLKSPTVLAKTLALVKLPTHRCRPSRHPRTPPGLASPTFRTDVLAMMDSPPDPQKIAYVFSLRNLHAGWTPDQRIFYFTWLRDEQEKRGTESYQKLLDNISREAYDNATDVDRLAIDAAGLHKPPKAAALPRPIGPGQQYTVDSLIALSAAQPAGRNFAKGKRALRPPAASSATALTAPVARPVPT